MPKRLPDRIRRVASAPPAPIAATAGGTIGPAGTAAAATATTTVHCFAVIRHSVTRDSLRHATRFNLRQGQDNRDQTQDRRKPSVQLDEEPPITLCELEATADLPPPHSQLMSKSTGIPASSRLFDLNGEVNNASKKDINAAIVDDDRQFCYKINPDEIFGTHGIRAFLTSPAVPSTIHSSALPECVVKLP